MYVYSVLAPTAKVSRCLTIGYLIFSPSDCNRIFRTATAQGCRRLQKGASKTQPKPPTMSPTARYPIRPASNVRKPEILSLRFPNTQTYHTFYQGSLGGTLSRKGFRIVCRSSACTTLQTYAFNHGAFRDSLTLGQARRGYWCVVG